jgi:hypothetical protein
LSICVPCHFFGDAGNDPEGLSASPEARGKVEGLSLNCTGESRPCNYAATQFCQAETTTLFLGLEAEAASILTFSDILLHQSLYSFIDEGKTR